MELTVGGRELEYGLGKPKQIPYLRYVKMISDFAKAHAFGYTSIDDPQVVGEHCTVTLSLQATNRASRATFDVSEIGVYTVRGGTVVREQFFYDTT